MTYIATDRGHGMAIYGIGDTAEAAIEDARRDSNNPESEYNTFRATDQLVVFVREHGGAPDDVSWTLRNGMADLDDETE